MTHGCPDCRLPLVDKTYNQVSFRECPECTGLWILEKDLTSIEAEDAHALAIVDSLDRPTKDPVYNSGARPCPACGLLMERFRFLQSTSIILDRCVCCEGIWADDGELAQMARVLDIAPPTPPEHLALTQAKAEELMARFTAEHEARMARYEMITKACRAMSHRAWWY